MKESSIQVHIPCLQGPLVENPCNRVTIFSQDLSKLLIWLSFKTNENSSIVGGGGLPLWLAHPWTPLRRPAQPRAPSGEGATSSLGVLKPEAHLPVISPVAPSSLFSSPFALDSPYLTPKHSPGTLSVIDAGNMLVSLGTASTLWRGGSTLLASLPNWLPYLFTVPSDNATCRREGL